MKLNEIKRIQQLAGLLKEDMTSGDADFEQYTDTLLNEIAEKVKELEELMESDTDYILDMVKNHIEGKNIDLEDENLPF
jgi:hypothetical protein